MGKKKPTLLQDAIGRPTVTKYYPVVLNPSEKQGSGKTIGKGRRNCMFG